MNRSLLACLLLLSVAIGVPGSAHAQSGTETPTPCCDDDFGGGFEATLYGVVGGGFLLLVTFALVVAEATMPDPTSADRSDE